MRQTKALLLSILMMICLFSSRVHADMGAAASEFFGVRRSVATIIFCGLGGAVLGISTLSFYGDPQNHIGNITTGLALGIIGGATYVTMRDTTPQDSFTELNVKTKNEFIMNHQSGQQGRWPQLVMQWSF